MKTNTEWSRRVFAEIDKLYQAITSKPASRNKWHEIDALQVIQSRYELLESKYHKETGNR